MRDPSLRVSTLRRHLVSGNPSRSQPSDKIAFGYKTESIVWASGAGSNFRSPKTNQDAVAIASDTDGLRESCSLCDGHGDYGEYVSKLVSEALVDEVPSVAEDERQLSDQVQQSVIDRMGSASLYSGCTGVWVRKLKDSIRICNVGDSRCIVVDSNWRILFQTRDHKPDDPVERKRIESFGGFVTKRPGSVPRVAGLALSRAFGDFAASSSGVCAVPEVTEINELHDIRYVFIASDGVFDVLSSEQVVAFLRDGLDERNAAPDVILRSLVETCRHLWSDDTDGEYCDDITCVLWSLSG